MPAEYNNEGIEIKRNQVLDDMDKAYMLINYPRAEAAPETPEWTFEHALDVAGVDATAKATLLEHWAAKKYEDVRTTFNNWNAIAQATAGF